jgi:glycine oxidase
VQVTVIGAGVAGLAAAVELAERGARVEVLERAPQLSAAGCSWFAGGMLAPWCERENSVPLVAQLGAESLQWWRARWPQTRVQGTLVVAHARDQGELKQFARRTAHYATLEAAGIAALEPELAGRFAHALYFAAEGHLDPRAALAGLAARLQELGVRVRCGVAADPRTLRGAVLDCSGYAARAQLPQLRGVKGEMLLLRAPEVRLSRPVRLLHPRVPVYVVPRGAGIYMVGATMVESDDATQVTARGLLELLSAAYALHPAFGEAQLVETGSAVRAAFPDNLPRLLRSADTWYLNGLFRHGFLLAPALAWRAAEVLLHGRHFPEVMDEDSRQRRLA